MQTKHFKTREQLIEEVKRQAPWATGPASPIQGGRKQAEKKLNNINPIDYGKTRNYGSGHVTKLSPYLHHGVLSLNEVRNYALSCSNEPEQAQHFIQELCWRDFWQLMAHRYPKWLWNDVEPYKTGFKPADYQQDLPDDIREGKTDVACINDFIKTLIATGYIHNHARMYIASYVVHFRKIKWQAGAQWFLEHLLDGDEASNNFSWQWIASTFSNKPYIFNLENVQKYFGNQVNTLEENNSRLNASYDFLNQQLFPNVHAI